MTKWWVGKETGKEHRAAVGADSTPSWSWNLPVCDSAVTRRQFAKT